MRKSFGARALSYPQPVLMIATYGAGGTPDVMNAAWGGISDEGRDVDFRQYLRTGDYGK